MKIDNVNERKMMLKAIPNLYDYSITSDGEIWSSRDYRFLKSNPKEAYKSVGINGRHYLIHRLVLETFIGPCPEGEVCRHLDGDKRNNSLNNLCWGTLKENTQDAIRHGTHSQPRGRWCL